MKYDIITFGSATLDVFLQTRDFLIKPVKKFVTQKGVCFPWGSKVDVKNLCFYSGGGGTNTAATLAIQGFKVAFCGKIGNDFAGQEVLKDLKKFKIDTKFVFKTKIVATNSSIIFSWGKPRTAFVWRGASELLEKKEIPWQKLRPRWFYLAPLSGKQAKLFGFLVNFAKKNNIKIFANPGNSQINLGVKKLRPILSKIDILLLNQEEASLLTKVPYQREKKVFEKLDDLVPGIAIMTKGKDGAVVSDGNFLWEVKAPKVSVVEKTGAGDAFGSGFLANFIKNEDIEHALQFAIANSTACIQKTGAKHGLLKKGQTWRKVKVVKKKI